MAEFIIYDSKTGAYTRVTQARAGFDDDSYGFVPVPEPIRRAMAESVCHQVFPGLPPTPSLDEQLHDTFGLPFEEQ